MPPSPFFMCAAIISIFLYTCNNGDYYSEFYQDIHYNATRLTCSPEYLTISKWIAVIFIIYMKNIKCTPIRTKLNRYLNFSWKAYTLEA